MNDAKGEVLNYTAPQGAVVLLDTPGPGSVEGSAECLQARAWHILCSEGLHILLLRLFWAGLGVEGPWAWGCSGQSLQKSHLVRGAVSEVHRLQDKGHPGKLVPIPIQLACFCH